MGVYYYLINMTKRHNIESLSWRTLPPSFKNVILIAEKLGWDLEKDMIVACGDCGDCLVFKKDEEEKEEEETEEKEKKE